MRVENLRTQHRACYTITSPSVSVQGESPVALASIGSWGVDTDLFTVIGRTGTAFVVLYNVT